MTDVVLDSNLSTDLYLIATNCKYNLGRAAELLLVGSVLNSQKIFYRDEQRHETEIRRNFGKAMIISPQTHVQNCCWVLEILFSEVYDRLFLMLGLSFLPLESKNCTPLTPIKSLIHSADPILEIFFFSGCFACKPPACFSKLHLCSYIEL